MSIRSAALGAALLACAALAQPALAHEGHDHGAAAPAGPATVAPRGEASSEAFELVAVAHDGALTLYLDRTRTNEPVRDARIAIETPEGPRDAAATPDGAYALAAPWLATPGDHDLVATIVADGAVDVLTVPLTVPAPPTAAAAVSAIPPALAALARQVRAGLPAAGPALAAVAGLAFLLGMLANALLRGRRAAPALTLVALALAILLGSAALVHAGEGHDHAGGSPLTGAALTAPHAATPERAQRMPDGTVFVPKPTQRLLALRTDVTERADHRRGVAMPGRIVPDPNASGLVQSGVGGRLSPPASGLFPRLGSPVRRGEVLATVTPPVQAVDVSDMRQTQGELDQQIAIVERRVDRFRRLVPSGAVAQVQLDDALAELKGLTDRRGALERVRREPEALIAPVDGVIAQAAAVAGQMAVPGAMVFQIVNPARLWVEALSFDALAAAGDATARLADGRTFPLSYRGSGLADRNQAIPVQFAIQGDAASLRIGQFVTVLAGTDVRLRGLALPRAAVVRAGDGQDVVYEHVSAERFAPRPVRVEPLDGGRVLVAGGLEAGRRVVVTGAELLDQVR